MEGIVGVTAVAGAGEAGSAGDDEAGPFGTEHLEGRDVAHAYAEAGVGDLDLLRGVGDDFVGDHHVVVGMGVGNQVVVGVLQKKATAAGSHPAPLAQVLVSANGSPAR